VARCRGRLSDVRSRPYFSVCYEVFGRKVTTLRRGKRETLFEDQHHRPMDSVATFLCNDRVVMSTVDR
jgi:hypothetical protein